MIMKPPHPAREDRPPPQRFKVVNPRILNPRGPPRVVPTRVARATSHQPPATSHQPPDGGSMKPAGPVIGVLALQGDVPEHLRALESAGARPTPVRRPEELDRVDGLVIPGGESTTL